MYSKLNTMIKRLDFTLDYDGLCEDVELFEIGNEDLTDEVECSDVDSFVKEIGKGLVISQHRTEVSVEWGNKMSLKFRYFNSPNDGDFDDYEIEIEPIEFKWEQ